jgi:hypothetical protein
MLLNFLDFENIDFSALTDADLNALFNRLKKMLEDELANGDENLKNLLLALIHAIDGSGSGIDADFLDGLDSTQFMRRDQTTTPTQTNKFDLGSAEQKWNNVYATNFMGTALQAKYADLAEKYTCKDDLEIGDVVLISSLDEVDVEKSNIICSHKVLGVYSFEPAFKMNSDLKDGKYIALKGRVPIKVYGKCNKGDPLVSYTKGSAISIFNPAIKHLNVNPVCVFAKALENKTEKDYKLIECVI